MANKENPYASKISFDVARTHEYIHTYESLIDILLDCRVENFCWLDCNENSEDEVISVEDMTNGKQFNVIVPKDIFDEEGFRKFCKGHATLLWIDPRRPTKTRGLDY